MKALAKVPADRYANAAEFADALEEAERLQAARGSASITGAPSPVVKRTAARRERSGGDGDRRRGAYGRRVLSRGERSDRMDHSIRIASLCSRSACPAGFKGSLVNRRRHRNSHRPFARRNRIAAMDRRVALAARVEQFERRTMGGSIPASRGGSHAVNASGFYLSGRVVGHSDSVEVLVDLIDVAGDSIVRQGRATGDHGRRMAHRLAVGKHDSSRAGSGSDRT